MAELLGTPPPDDTERGSSGTGRALLTADELARYERRAAALALDDLLRWLHR